MKKKDNHCMVGKNKGVKILEDLVFAYGDKTKTLPILGIGECHNSLDMLSLFVDYNSYCLDMNKKLEDKSYVSIGYNKSDYDMMAVYNIDHGTHMLNVWKYRNWMDENGSSK